MILSGFLAGAHAAPPPLPEALGGLGTRAVEPADTNARTPLDDLLRNVEANSGAAAGGESDGAIDLNAMRLYARGRTLLLEGHPAEAAAMLARALERAPDAGRIARELAMAQAASGRGREARASLERAASLGAGDARALYVLASLQISQGSPDEGLKNLLRAGAHETSARDPALATLIDLALARALWAGGMVRAGAEAAERSARSSRNIRSRSVFDQEVAMALPTMGSALDDAGDAWMRLGEPGRALGAYQSAREFGVPILSPIVPKLVHALAAADRAHEAASTLAQAFSDPEHRLDERLILAIDQIPAQSRAGLLASLDAARDEPWCVGEALVWIERARARAAREDRATILRALALEHPEHAEALLDLITSAAGSDEAARDLAPLLADSAPRARLLLTLSALAREGAFDVPALVASLARTPGTHLAQAAILIGADRAIESEHLLAQPRDGHPPSARADASLLRALALWESGRLDEGRSALSDFAGDASVDGRIARARSLLMMQQTDEARSLLEALLGEGLSSSNEIAARSLLLQAGGLDEERERALLDRLLELDPAHAGALDRLRERAQGGRSDEGPALGDRLRAHAGGSRLRRLLACEALIARGERAEGEAVLSAMVLETPVPDRALDLMMNLWLSTRGVEREASILRGINFLDRLLRERGQAPALLMARVSLLSAIGRTNEAIEFLERARDEGSLRSPALARTLEALLMETPDRADEGRRSRERRLSRQPLGVYERVEWIADRIAGSAPADAAAHLDALPVSALTPDQELLLMSALSELASRASREPTGPLRGPMIALLDRASALGARIPPPLLELHLALLTTIDPPDLDRIARSAVGARRAIPGPEGEPVALTPVRYLISERRARDALDAQAAIARALGEHGFPVASGASVELWTRLVVQEGDADDARNMLELVRSDEALRGVFGRTSRGLENVLEGDSLRAEAAFQIAAAHASLGHDASAIAGYELALRFDPRHPWSANNLGYSLLERGEDLARAERLIETAHEQIPDDDSIIDSLGWVRYLRGEIGDTMDARGNLVREGAVTLLRRSVAIAGDDAGAVPLDHLGDALWRAGEHASAREMWTRALASGERELDELGGQLAPDHPTLAEIRRIVESCRAKLDASGRGEEPVVAPLADVP